jgi:asparagine synthetase B (glutamine-hydrolysing)
MEFMFRIPFEWVYGRGYRYFMEKSLSDIIVPSWIFRRPHKGFRAPVETWLKTQKWQEVVYDYLSQKTVKERGLFSPKFVQEILDKFYSGEKFLGKPQQGRAQPLSLTIWSLLALESWFQIFL